MKATEETRDFEPIFFTGIYDDIPLPSDDVVLEEINAFIDDMDKYRIEEIGSDVVGFIYENLIPDEERHNLGQFYTPPQIAELITKWAVRDKEDIILDPACGSGTFLVKAYNILKDLNSTVTESQIHKKIINQIYGFDINPFPAHLTALNLAIRDVKYPTSEMNIIVEDAFKLRSQQEVFSSYVVKTAQGDQRRKINIPVVSAVVANPPYTRWIEIPEDTRKIIAQTMDRTLSEYGLVGGIYAASETGIYVYFILHGLSFVQEGGRVAMIVSNAWLQTDYGIKFANFLLDHFRIISVIDFSNRLFRVPIIGTCILLLEKTSDDKSRKNNRTSFIYVNKEVSVDEILHAIKKPQSKQSKFIINTINQRHLPRDKKWIQVLFDSTYVEKKMAKSKRVVKMKELFHTYRGNTQWAKWLYEHSARPGDPEEFFQLDKGTIDKWGLGKYAHPALTSVRYAKNFTFTQKDWEALGRTGDTKKWFFVCHEAKGRLPSNIIEYVKWGETECRTTIKEARGGGKICSQTWTCILRNKTKGFFGWYDLGGILKTTIFAVYHSRYKTRFIIPKYDVAFYHAVLAFVPKPKLSELQVKALAAYLNSTIVQIYVESHGRVVSVGPIALEISQAENMPILDVTKLGQKDLKVLAGLFDELDAESRRIGGADNEENLKRLNPIFDKIDRKIATLIGLQLSLVPRLRLLADALVERRLSGSKVAKPETVKGEDIPRIKIPKKLKDPAEGTIPLDRWTDLK